MADNKKGNTIVPAGRASQTNETSLRRAGSDNPQDVGLLTAQDLNSILEVNQKALTIYLEVEKQNERILENLQDNIEKSEKFEIIEDEIKEVRRDLKTTHEALGENEDTLKEIKKKLEDIDKNMFRLVLILGSAGIGTVITIIQTFLNHK